MDIQQLEQSCDILVSECVTQTLRGKWMTERGLGITDGWHRLEPEEKRKLFGIMLATRLRALAAIDDDATVQKVESITDYEEIKRAIEKGVLDKDSQAFLADFIASEEWNNHKLRRIHIIRIIAYLKILESMPELRNSVPENLDEVYFKFCPRRPNEMWDAFWDNLAPQITEEIPDNVMDILPKIEEVLGENLVQQANKVFEEPGRFEEIFDQWYSDPEFKKDFFETFNRVLSLMLRRARHLPKGEKSLNKKPFYFGDRSAIICRQALDSFATNQIIGSFVQAQGINVRVTQYAQARGLSASVSDKGLIIVDNKSKTTIELGKNPELLRTSRYMPYLHLHLHRWVKAANEHHSLSISHQACER